MSEKWGKKRKHGIMKWEKKKGESEQKETGNEGRKKRSE